MNQGSLLTWIYSSPILASSWKFMTGGPKAHIHPRRPRCVLTVHRLCFHSLFNFCSSFLCPLVIPFMTLIATQSWCYFMMLILVFFRRASQDICFAILLDKKDQFFSLVKWFSVLPSSWMWTFLQKANSKWAEFICTPCGYFLKDKLLALDFLLTQSPTSFLLSEKQQPAVHPVKEAPAVHPVKEARHRGGQNLLASLDPYMTMWSRDPLDGLNVTWKEKPKQTPLLFAPLHSVVS